MRIETINNHRVVCGHIFPLEELKVESLWMQADGTPRVVEIISIDGKWVTYKSPVETAHYTKDWFSFQMRYSLILKEKDMVRYEDALSNNGRRPIEKFQQDQIMELADAFAKANVKVAVATATGMYGSQEVQELVSGALAARRNLEWYIQSIGVA